MIDRSVATRDAPRFAFGKNWAEFLRDVDEERIAHAERSLQTMLRVENLHGRRFIDVGSGSGLFSLAARRLGATVYSFDFDADSVECTERLKRRYFTDDEKWTVCAGSVLDEAFLRSLGEWDVVYSWGVLHHTGDLWRAMEGVSHLVRPGGSLFIALYADQGRTSSRWLRIKQVYNALPRGMRWLVLWPVTLRLWGPQCVRDLLSGRPLHTWRNYSRTSARGMSPWRDVVDWVGGLPFEVASPGDVFSFFRDRGFELENLVTVRGGHGCNEFVFRRNPQ